MSEEYKEAPIWKQRLTILPEHMRDGMERWIQHGVLPGHFLTAVLENDLREAFGRADEINTAAMRTWCVYLYSYAPRKCSGSVERVKNWAKHRGLDGINV